MTATDDGALVFHRIVITPETVQEVDGLPLVTIQRSAVVRTRLTRGLVTERPWVAILGGLLVTALGLAGIRILVAALAGSAQVRI